MCKILHRKPIAIFLEMIILFVFFLYIMKDVLLNWEDQAQICSDTDLVINTCF